MQNLGRSGPVEQLFVFVFVFLVTLDSSNLSVCPLQVPEADASIQCIAVDPDATNMAAINNKGNCYIWRISPGQEDAISQLHPRTKIPAHKKYGLKCKFSPDCT